MSSLMTETGNVGFKLQQEGETAITIPQREEGVPFHSCKYVI